MKITIEMESVKDAREASATLIEFMVGMGGGIPAEGYPSVIVPTKHHPADSCKDLVKKEDEIPSEKKTVEAPDKEKAVTKKSRRLTATKRADELGIEWTTKTGTAAIEARIKAFEDDSKPDDKTPDKTAGKKDPAKGKGKKKPVYNEKKTKEMCVYYVNELPGTTEEKKEALYGNILQKFGGATKMSEIIENDNVQIVGEVLAAHIAYHTVVVEVGENAATGAVVLIAATEDLLEVQPMLHAPLTEALNIILKEARELKEKEDGKPEE